MLTVVVSGTLSRENHPLAIPFFGNKCNHVVSETQVPSTANFDVERGLLETQPFERFPTEE